MDKVEITDFLEALNTELQSRGVKGEICVVGGAAMVLAFNARNSTKDIDAVFAPAGEVREAAEKVAASMSLPPDILNDGVKGFFHCEPEKRKLLEFSSLSVWSPPPEYLLAMKCCAARRGSRDVEDIVFLAGHLGLSSSSAIVSIVETFVPSELIPVKARFILEELFDNSISPEL